MPSVTRLVFAALVLIIVAVAAPVAHADRCVGAKLRAIGKKEYGLFTCQAKVAANGDSSGLAACESNVRAKFSTAFANAGACLGDQTRCEDMADACVAAVAALLTEPFPSACEAAKRKAAAKLVKKELGCYARAARRGESVDLTCIAKTRDRFAVALTRAGTCPDGGSPQTEVETNCVRPVVGIGQAIDVCPASTTTSTSSSTTTSTTICGPGSLDTTFGSGGIVTTSIGETSVGSAVAIDGSGRIVVAGTSRNGTNSDFAVVRYLPSGSLDTTFGSGGTVTTPIGAGDDGGSAVAIDGSGRIVVAGTSYMGPGDDDFAVVRYLRSGSLDVTFGSGGTVTTPIGAGNDVGSAVAIDGSGRIVVAGTSDTNLYPYPWNGGDFAVVRYTASGSLDTTFGSGGTVTTPIGTVAAGRAVAIDGNGQIVVAGDAGWRGGRGAAFAGAVVRYLASGSLDATFGSGGMAMTEFLSDEEVVGIAMGAMAIDGSGRIVIAGYPFMARFLASGNLDTTFGSGGTVWWPSWEIGGSAVAIDGSGRIVVAGGSYVGPSGDADFAVLRYLPSGSPDATFGSGGTVMTTIGAGYDAGDAVAIDGSGRIVVAGRSWNGTNNDIAVVRYLGDSTGCQ